jgi:hypothetical protein
MDDLVRGASFVPQIQSFPAISFLFIDVTRLGGVTLDRPPGSMQASKFLQDVQKHLPEVYFSFAHD